MTLIGSIYFNISFKIPLFLFHPVLILHALVLCGHDKHEIRGDHVEAQHARKRRVQVNQVAQHLLPGSN
jgi:hypothetical protein